jgi:thiol-disulfide isomerase/thioredoxin
MGLKPLLCSAILTLFVSVTYAQPKVIVAATGEAEITKNATPANMTTRRRGTVVLPSVSSPVLFRVSGHNGVYNDLYLSVAFDLDGNGEFDLDTERYLVSEQFVNLGGTTYEFTVERDGGHVTFVPQTQKHADRLTLKTGFPAPEFSFVDLNDKKRRLSDYRGKVVLLDFWGTWCGPCVAGVPELVDLYEKYHARGFEIIGIEANDTPANVTEFTQAHAMTWTQTIEKDKGVIGALHRIEGWPTAFLIGPDGKFLAANYLGEVDLRAELKKAFPTVPLPTETSRPDFRVPRTAATIR